MEVLFAEVWGFVRWLEHKQFPECPYVVFELKLSPAQIEYAISGQRVERTSIAARIHIAVHQS